MKENKKRKSLNRSAKFGSTKLTFVEFLCVLIGVVLIGYLILSILN
jgi:cell division septal protein FtsQ